MHLTPCEVSVLRQKATGKSSAEVAATLFISRRTVDFHLSSIYLKLEVHSLLQAILAAQALQAQGKLPEDLFCEEQT